MIDKEEVIRGGRLKEIREKLGLSQEDFADVLQISRGHLSQIENGKRNISYSIISLLSEKLPVVNLNWLIIGSGKMFFSKSEKQYVSEPENVTFFSHLTGESRHLTGFSRGKNILVRISDEKKYALGLSEKYLDEKMEKVIIPGVEGEARTFAISGVSMVPVLEDGDYIICKPAQLPEIKNGKIYAVVSKGLGINAKIIEPQKDGLLMISANSEMYQPIFIAYEEIREVWEVTHRLTSSLIDPRLFADQAEQARIKKIEEWIKRQDQNF